MPVPRGGNICCASQSRDVVLELVTVGPDERGYRIQLSGEPPRLRLAPAIDNARETAPDRFLGNDADGIYLPPCRRVCTCAARRTNRQGGCAPAIAINPSFQLIESDHSSDIADRPATSRLLGGPPGQYRAEDVINRILTRTGHSSWTNLLRLLSLDNPRSDSSLKMANLTQGPLC